MRWSSEHLRRWLPVPVFGVFLLYAFGVLVDASTLTRQAGMAAVVALVGYAALATWGAPPRVRWALLAGVVAVGAAVWLNLPDPPPEGPTNALVRLDHDVLDSYWQTAVHKVRWTALGMLLGAAGGLVAVLALPPAAVRRRVWALVLASVAVVLVLASTANSLAAYADRTGRGADLLGAVWLPVLAGLLATAVADLAALRGRGWQAALAGLGAGMLAIVALGLAVDTGRAMPLPPSDGFLSLGILYSYGTGPSTWDVQDAMTALATLLGPLLIVIATTRPPSETP